MQSIWFINLIVNDKLLSNFNRLSLASTNLNLDINYFYVVGVGHKQQLLVDTKVNIGLVVAKIFDFKGRSI